MGTLFLLVSVWLVATSAADETKDSFEVNQQVGGLALADIQEKLATMELKLEERDDKYFALEKKLEERDDMYFAMQQKLEIMEAKLELATKATTSPRHDQEENQIAFSVVSHDDFGPVIVNTNIPFPVVYENIGNSWQPSINAFQITKAGVYMFTVSVLGDGSVLAQISIVHTTPSGGKKVAGIASTGTGSTTAATSSIFEAEIGDFVSVQLWPGGKLESSEETVYSSFCGFLLYA